MKKVVLILMILSWVGVYAQKTFIYSKPEMDYREGLELFDKQMYGAAQKQFGNVIKTIENGELRMENEKNSSIILSNSQYYYATCAIELLNDDAEELMDAFINNNSESPKAKIAYFTLGKYQYRKKSFSKAVQSFLKTDTYNLTAEDLAEYNFKLGYSYLRVNKTDEASRVLAEVKDKKNKYEKPATYYYSHIAYTKKNYQLALDGFQKLQNDAYYGGTVQYYIVQIYFMQGKYDELISAATKFKDSAKAGSSGEIARLLGVSYYRTGKYKEAIPYLEKFREKSGAGASREEGYELGYAYYKSRDFKKALKQLEKVAVKEDSLTQNANYIAADCYLKTGQKQYARNAFAAASRQSFNKSIQEDALYNYSKLSYELSMNPYNEAVVSIQKYLKTYPQSGKSDEMYSYLVNIYLTTKNYRDALISIESIKNKNEKIKAAYQRVAYCRAVELFSNKDFGGAIKLFNKTLSAGAEKDYTPKAIYWKAEAYYRLTNYDSAAYNYKRFLVTPGAYSLPFFNVANYNTGYCYFRQKQYNDAIVPYKKFVSASGKLSKDMLNDAYNRIGDCYYISKDNQQAIENYDKAISIGKVDGDYALYQKALAYGILNRFDKKAEALTTLLKDFKKSTYADDAEFELANAYIAQNDNANALKTFDRLIKNNPSGSYVKASMLKMGLLQRNMNRDGDALATFRKVVSAYPGTPESKEALVSIKNIYVDQNQVDSFFVYVKKIPFANITNAAQDSITYTAVENRFMNADCDKAIKGFEDYLRKFSDGIFVTEANYYLAECNYSMQNYEEALNGYEYVIGKPKSKFTENALLKAADIKYRKKDYESAISDFRKLEQVADYKNNILTARTGAMRANFILNKYPQAIEASRKLLETPKLATDIAQEAHLIIARSAMAIDSTELARKEFNMVNRLAVNEMAAEAKYNLAFIQYKLGMYDESEKQVFELINQVPSYDFWIAKGFILLADNYVKAGNDFQAKQTLQSIIDNYEGEELKNVAMEKINGIMEREKAAEQEKAKKQLEMQFGKDSTDFSEPFNVKDTIH